MTDDKFEASEMHDGSPIVHRDKNVSRRMAAFLMGPGVFTIGLAIFVALVNESSQKPLPAAALPFVVAALALFGLGFIGMGVAFAVLRTLVTAEAVHVKYGLWGPTIPLEAITKCSVVPYDWTEFGGWGIRIGRNGRAYVPKSGPVVEILYDEGGTSRRVLVGATDAAGTAAEINRARSARANQRPRIAEGLEAPAKTSEAAEAEAELRADADAEAERETASERSRGA